jgi:hypothetical protein
MKQQTSAAHQGWFRRIAPVVCLFFLAPLFGEFLLGNQRVVNLPILPVFGLLYGCGAILVREITRRVGGGYGMMLGLGLAYALFEEGIVDQLFFNINYFEGQADITTTLIPGIGIDAWLTLLLLAMHSIWSICIPIVLVEMIFKKRGPGPWLGKSALAVVSVLFLAGSAYLGWAVYTDKQFLAPAGPLLILVAAMVGIIFTTFRVRKWQPRLPVFSAPKPWLIGVTAFVFSTLYIVGGGLPGWLRVVSALVLAGIFFTLVRAWSQKGWSDVHTIALAAGGIATYAWLGAFMKPESGPKTMADHIGTVILIVFAFTLVVQALKTVRLAQK